METRYTLTEEGKKYLIRGLPEKTLEEFLKNPAPIAEAKKHMENFSIALMWAKKKGMVKIEAGKLVLTKKPQKHPEEAGLRMVSEGRRPDKKTAETLIRRNLIKEEREDIHRQAQRLIGKEVSGLTPELIKSGYWKSVRLKPYNVVLIGRRTYPGKPHIISFYIEKIRNIFFDAGFREAEGPLVESSFWNFDALYQPQDHPARDLADTFYLKQPNTSRLPAKGLVQNVKKTHENGWNTGSKGWGYMWSEEKSRQPVLRTHTTAVSARSLVGLKPPAKIFCIGRVFRNETIDYKHLPEFTQVEGIVAAEGLNFRHLLGYLKDFYARLGFDKVRFRPSYFPYTEMSVEPEIYFENRNEWLEMGGAGIFREEVTKPLGIDVPVLAWGLGLERPIMLKHGIKDIRMFYHKNDLDFLRRGVWL